MLSALKADAKLADIPVVMLTIVDDQNMGYSLGASEYLTKPIDRDKLAAVLRKYAGEKQIGSALVIEDDDAAREGLCSQLRSHGWSVTEAVNGLVGLERLAESRPSIILLDLMMPEMDGFQFVEELRKHPEWGDIPILVITAKDLSTEERLRLNGHVALVLQKGRYDAEDLLRETGRMVAGRIRTQMRKETPVAP